MSTSDPQRAPDFPGSEELGSDAAASPAARTGAPLSEALRKQLAKLMVDGADWMEQHWLAVRWGAMAVTAGSLAFLLHTGHIPGWRQYSSLAELPARLLAPEGPRLPVVLHSVAQHGDVLFLRAAHYPGLRRLVNGYRRLPPAAVARRAGDSGQLLHCHLAGVLQPTPAALQYLRQLDYNAVHRLRLLSIVDAADQSWTEAAAPDAAAAPGKPNVAGGRWLLLGGSGRAAPDWRQAAQPAAPAAAALHPPPVTGVGLKALAPTEISGQQQPSEQQQQQQMPGDAGGRMQGSEAMLWGELYAREPRRGLAALLPRRRVDVAERLISQGEAAMMEPIDLEWLGASWLRIDRLYAAEQAAVQAGRGIWAVRRPTLAEWSRSLARSAWVRVRHAARSSAAATSTSVTSAAVAAGGAVTGAAAATSRAVAGTAAAAGSVATDAAAAAGNVLTGAAVAAGRTVTGAAATAGSAVSNAAAAAGSTVSDAAAAAGTAVSDAAAAASAAASEVWTAAKPAAMSAMSKAAGQAGGAWSQAVAAVSNAAGTVPKVGSLWRAEGAPKDPAAASPTPTPAGADSEPSETPPAMKNSTDEGGPSCQQTT